MSGLFYGFLRRYIQSHCEPSTFTSSDIEKHIAKRLKSKLNNYSDSEFAMDLFETSLGKTMVIVDSVFYASGKKDISGITLIHPFSKKLNNLYFQTRKNFDAFYSYYKQTNKLRRLAFLDDTFSNNQEKMEQFKEFYSDFLEILKEEGYSDIVFYSSFTGSVEEVFSVTSVSQKENYYPDCDIIMNESPVEVTKENLLKAVEKKYPSPRAVYLYGNYDNYDSNFININKLLKNGDSLFTSNALILIRYSHGNAKGFSYMVYSVIKKAIVEYIKNPISKEAKRLLSLFFNKSKYFKLPMFFKEYKSIAIKQEFVSFEDALFIRRFAERAVQNAFGTSLKIDIRVQGLDAVGDFNCEALGFVASDPKRYCSFSKNIMFLNATAAKYANLDLVENIFVIHLFLADVILRDIFDAELYHKIRIYDPVSSMLTDELEDTRGEDYERFCRKMEKILSILLKQQG